MVVGSRGFVGGGVDVVRTGDGNVGQEPTEDVSLAVSLPASVTEATSYLGKKELVKPRPQQNNRNRIVWPPPREAETARCVLHSSVDHKLRNGSPRGTWKLARAEARDSPRPCFSDANYRRDIAPSRHRQSSRSIGTPESADGRAESEAILRISHMPIGGESNACARLSVCSIETQR